jgi:MoxR-like ATPase
MTLDIYKSTFISEPSAPVEIGQIARIDDPRGYTADEDLVAAVNVALVLGKPLLVTGEPGTGKTELAGSVALQLGLPGIERFDTKSTSQSVELFYRFDSLARFHSANIDDTRRRAMDFISFGPLGRAILLSLSPSHGVFSALRIRHSEERPGEAAPQARRSVVLIDEIDKAPRDFPNDLLDAIDRFRFSIRELEADTVERLVQKSGSAEITAARALRPVVIITSNSENTLPAPFLRRCIYHHIKFPVGGQLRAIVARRVPGAPGESPQGAAPRLTRLDATTLTQARSISEEDSQPLLATAVKFFEGLRAGPISKRPSTAELIDWLSYLLASGAQVTQALGALPPKVVQQSLGILVKSEQDLALAQRQAAALASHPDAPAVA